MVVLGRMRNRLPLDLNHCVKVRPKKRGVEYSFLFMHPDGKQLAKIGKLLEAGKLRPVIDKVFPFAQAKEALAYLEKVRAKGKVVVQVK